MAIEKSQFRVVQASNLSRVFTRLPRLTEQLAGRFKVGQNELDGVAVAAVLQDLAWRILDDLDLVEIEQLAVLVASLPTLIGRRLDDEEGNLNIPAKVRRIGGRLLDLQDAFDPDAENEFDGLIKYATEGRPSILKVMERTMAWHDGAG